MEKKKNVVSSTPFCVSSVIIIYMRVIPRPMVQKRNCVCNLCVLLMWRVMIFQEKCTTIPPHTNVLFGDVIICVCRVCK